jgi:hypothetical protein
LLYFLLCPWCRGGAENLKQNNGDIPGYGDQVEQKHEETKRHEPGLEGFAALYHVQHRGIISTILFLCDSLVIILPESL